MSMEDFKKKAKTEELKNLKEEVKKLQEIKEIEMDIAKEKQLMKALKPSLINRLLAKIK